MNAEDFQDFIKKECALLGVELEVSPFTFVQFNSTRSNGYFNDEKNGGPKLAYCTGKDFQIWFPIAVHEYNHMLQWAEESPLWGPAGESDQTLWPWLSGSRTLTPEQARYHAMNSLRCELDCERRTIAMAREMDLPGDWDLYTKMANAYVYFYHLLVKHGKWYQIGKEPYSIPELVAAMPDHLNDDHETITPEMEALFEKHMPYLM